MPKIGEILAEKDLERVTLMGDLPYDIILDIFSKLPVKTLGRAKVTCKFLHMAISDPKFAKMHLLGAIQNPGMLYSFGYDYPKMYFTKDIDGNIEGIKISSYRENELRCQSSTGGLLVWYKRPYFYILNPITGERVQAPRDPVEYLYSWGFGFSKSRMEHIIVKFGSPVPIKFHDEGTALDGTIYTLGSASWKRINEHKLIGCTHLFVEHIDCDGTLFWMSSRMYCGTEDMSSVESFDIFSEEFRSWPNPGPKDYRLKAWSIRLFKMGETVAQAWSGRTSVIIWSLRDKEKDTWTKEYAFSISPKSLPISISSIGVWMGQQYLYQFGYTGSPKIKKKFHLACVIYDSNTETVRTIGGLPFSEIESSIKISTKLKTLRQLSATSHVGCLISPKGVI